MLDLAPGAHVRPLSGIRAWGRDRIPVTGCSLRRTRVCAWESEYQPIPKALRPAPPAVGNDNLRQHLVDELPCPVGGRADKLRRVEAADERHVGAELFSRETDRSVAERGRRNGLDPINAGLAQLRQDPFEETAHVWHEQLAVGMANVPIVLQLVQVLVGVQ